MESVHTQVALGRNVTQKVFVQHAEGTGIYTGLAAHTSVGPAADNSALVQLQGLCRTCSHAGRILTMTAVVRKHRHLSHLAVNQIEILVVALGAGRGTAPAANAVVQIEDDDLLTEDVLGTQINCSP
jgi:hypothetical protein